MNLPALPADVRRFLLASIASVPHLEALLLLRNDPAMDWNAVKLGEHLFASASRAESILHDLREQELCSATLPGHFRYSPRSAAVAATIDRLAEHYSRNLVQVSQLLHAKLDRQALDFSDAFKLRKDP
jgi:hypothetical protein